MQVKQYKYIKLCLTRTIVDQVPLCSLNLNSAKPVERTFPLTPLRAKESKAQSSASNDSDPPATLRLLLRLTGPLRGDVMALKKAAVSYFSFVDSVVGVASPYAEKVFNAMSSKYAIIPAVPVVVGAAVITPVVVGGTWKREGLQWRRFIFCMRMRRCPHARTHTHTHTRYVVLDAFSKQQQSLVAIESYSNVNLNPNVLQLA